MTVPADGATGLPAPDRFYFNLIGDTGDSDSAPFRVSAVDLAAVRRALNADSTLTGRHDFNRDGRVNALDLSAVRANLNRIMPAHVVAPPPPAALEVIRVTDEVLSESPLPSSRCAGETVRVRGIFCI